MDYLETSPLLGKLRADSLNKIIQFDVNLKAKRSKTKVSFGLKDLTAVNDLKVFSGALGIKHNCKFLLTEFEVRKLPLTKRFHVKLVSF